MSLAELREILRVIRSYRKAYKDSSYDFVFTASGKIRAFISALDDKEVCSEEDVSRFVTGKPNKPDIYRKLKSNFKEWLLKRFLFLEYHRHSMDSWQQANCALSYKQAAFRHLYFHGLREHARIVARETLGHSLDSGHTLVELECLINLRTDASLQGDKESFDDLTLSIDTAITKLKAEAYSQQAIDFYQCSQLHNTIPDQRIIDEVETYLQNIESFAHKDMTPLIESNWRFLKVFYAQLTNSQEQVVAECEGILGWYQSNTLFGPPWRVALVRMFKAAAHYSLGETSDGLNEIEEALSLVRTFRHNTLQMHEIAFLLYMQCADYENSYRIFREVLHHYNIGDSIHGELQKWRIYEIYIRMVSNKAQVSRLTFFGPGHFHAGTVLDLAPDYKHEKAGFYVLVLVAQIFLLTDEFISTQTAQVMDKLVDRGIALRRYITRYLRPAQAYSAQCLVRAIVEIISAEFNAYQARAIVDEYTKKIQDGPENGVDVDSIQVIPFDTLLELYYERVQAIEELRMIVRPMIEEKVSRFKRAA